MASPPWTYAFGWSPEPVASAALRGPRVVTTPRLPGFPYVPGVSGRNDFHVALAGVFFPAVFVPFTALLAAYHSFFPDLDDDHRRWGRRLSVLVALDLLIALLAYGGHAATLHRADDPFAPNLAIGVQFEHGVRGSGATVAATTADSPAARAGLHRGDVIVALDGSPVATPEALRTQIRGGHPGQGRRLQLRRADAEIAVVVVPDFRRLRRPLGRSLFARDSSIAPSPAWHLGSLELACAVLSSVTLAALWIVSRRRSSAAGALLGAVVLVLLGSSAAVYALARVLLWRIGPSLGVTLVLLVASPMAMGLLALVARSRLLRADALAPVPPPSHSLAGGVALGAWYLVTGTARLGWLLPFLSTCLHLPSERGAVQDMAAQVEFGVSGAVLIALAVAVAAPLGEELLFRGVLLPGLLRWWSPRWAIAATATLFGALHVSQYGLGALAVVFYGLVFGWARIATGRLAAPIVLHGTMNALILAALAAALHRAG